MMQPSTTMITKIITILVLCNYSAFDESHFLKKLRVNLRVFLTNQRLVSRYLLYFNILFNLHQMYQEWVYSVGIDSAERFVFSFMYLNTQFRTKTQFTFRKKKVESSLLVRLHWSIQNSSCTLNVPMFLQHVRDEHRIARCVWFPNMFRFNSFCFWEYRVSLYSLCFKGVFQRYTCFADLSRTTCALGRNYKHKVWDSRRLGNWKVC